MLSVARVTVQTLVFILHIYTRVPNLTMCALRCVGGSKKRGVGENFHACHNCKAPWHSPFQLDSAQGVNHMDVKF